jgi:hypothetical protein
VRTLVGFAVVILLLALVGWITFSSGSDRSSINLETEVIKEDTREIIESGADLLEATKPATEESESAEEPAARHEPPDPTPPTGSGDNTQAD